MGMLILLCGGRVRLAAVTALADGARCSASCTASSPGHRYQAAHRSRAAGLARVDESLVNHRSVAALQPRWPSPRWCVVRTGLARSRGDDGQQRAGQFRHAAGAAAGHGAVCARHREGEHAAPVAAEGRRAFRSEAADRGFTNIVALIAMEADHDAARP